LQAPLTPQAQFITGPAGRLFTLYHLPSPASGDKEPAALVFVAPFAEELNRSRHMIARQARALAAAGCAVLILDLFGTGDSQGDFTEASWPIWRADVVAAMAWLTAQGHARIGLWGLRLGTLLALDVLTELSETPDRLLLWQPVTSGKNFLNQFLRIRLAADLTGHSPRGETTKTLRARLAEGETLEIAGYGLTPAMAAAIEAADMARPPPPLPVFWHEVAGNEAREPAAGSRRVIERWRDAGVPVTTQVVAGPPFWTLQEPEWAPALIDAGIKAITGSEGP